MFVDRITGWFSPATPPAPPAAAAVPYDPTDPKQNPLNPQGLKPCCACPDTKKARDACFLKYDSSESEDKCRELVQSHLACMRRLGFKV
ncbi:cytochrome C oxidase copper chaperone [Thelephora ganbajun]|uniref:Cytochrome C oxidase copper chaperone n=1 Tax=Thelephora ganbajun TaxID=370292 RepID=A0ACB6ZX99_THEGA|nr:cytochrome C oxidase copper chaperone [Thelephora ganbajun]